jgi:hypothetical protein
MKIINKHFTRTKWQSVGLLYVLVLLAQVFVPFALQHASAGTLTSTYLRLNRMSAGTTTSFRLVFTTASAGATSVSINFTAGWASASGSVNGTQTVSSASCAADTGATALPGSITAAGASNTVTISSVTALSTTTAYCVDLTSTSAVTNATAGQYLPIITAGSDSTTLAIRTVGSNADQIAVSASVNPTFSFSLSSNSAALSTLSTSAPTESSAINGTVSTNAPQGWQMWAADLSGTPGLRSTTASKTISYSPAAGAAASALSAGNEGYNLGSRSISGTTCGTPTYGNFNSGTQYAGSGLDGTLRSLVSVTGAADTCALALRVNASISPTTPAATDYAGTMTVVAAGKF